MPKITFIEHDGQKTICESENNDSVMVLALENGLSGIDGDCGGECICATCHVYVEKQWVDQVGAPSSDEEALLSLNPERKENSRLGCQIKMRKELDGLIVHIPEFQY